MYKLCIAEDEYYVQKSLHTRIMMMPFDIDMKGFASNGEQALDLYYKYNPDIFLVDINMPESNGFYFIDKAKADPNNKTIFIIISGYSDFTYMRQAIQYSVFDYVKKPIIQEELEDVINRAIQLLEREKSEKFLLSKDYVYCDEYLSEIAGQKLQGTILCIYDRSNEKFAESYEAAELYLNLSEFGNMKTILLRNVKSICLFFLQDRIIPFEELRKINRNINQDLSKILISTYLKDDDFELALNNIQAALNRRFFHNFNFLLLNQSEKDCTNYLYNLELLKYAIDQGDAQTFRNQIANKLERIAQERNYLQLNSYYYQVILLLINKYSENNMNDPEYVRRELIPFALGKFNEYKQIEYSLLDMGTELIENIRKKNQSLDLISKVCIYLQNHFSESITLNDLAQYFFISPSYLSHYFKSKKNLSVVQYLQEIRLNKAKELLKNTQLSIADIADQVGYPDSNYFTKVFRKELQISPSDYRKSVI